MLRIKINGKKEFEVETGKQLLNGIPFSLNLSEIKPGFFHIIRDNKSFSAEVLEADYASKKFVLRINGNRYEAEVKDRFDELLHKLGMDKSTAKQNHSLKAPMPGLVLDIRIKEGDQINKGDTILVLEAMKMENVLRAAGNGLVKKIFVGKGDKVEKNQPLVEIGA